MQTFQDLIEHRAENVELSIKSDPAYSKAKDDLHRLYHAVRDLVPDRCAMTVINYDDAWSSYWCEAVSLAYKQGVKDGLCFHQEVQSFTGQVTQYAFGSEE